MKQLKIEKGQDRKYTLRTNATDKYLTEVSRHSKLTPEEEYEIAVKAKGGDPEAIDRLIHANLRFVISIAKKYASNPELLNELISEGNIGLVDSARTFDPSRGFKFISYAVWHIRKEMLRHLSSTKEMIRLPGHVARDISKLKKIESNLICVLDRDPTSDEIFEEFSKIEKSITPNKVNGLLQLTLSPIPFETNDDDQFSPSQWIESDTPEFKELENKDRASFINSMLGLLNSLERDIVIKHHGLDGNIAQSFTSISENYHMSSEWVRLVYNKAIRKLKHRYRNIVKY